MKFAMMSDTHYISRRMISDKTDKELLLQPDVTEAAVLQACEESDVLFIIGDLTNDGDRHSHEDFCNFLKEVKKNNKKIFVTFATHDFHHHKAYVRKYGETTEFNSNPWNSPYFDKEGTDWKKLTNDNSYISDEQCMNQFVDALSPEEIWDMYYEFGPNEAYSVNKESFSYCLDLDNDTRCLMLNDIFRNEEALKDKSPTYSPSCFKWIKQMYNESVRDGKYLFVCSHHPMLPAVPAHRLGAGKENRDMRSPIVGHTLADMGINLSFTGHSHFCDVGYLYSNEKNIIWDVTTPSVRFYPPAYRMIELDGKNGKLKYNCTYVNVPDKCNIEEESLFEHYHKIFYNQYYHSITGSNPALKKIMDNLTVKDIYFIVKSKAKLNKEEYEYIKNLKIFDLIIETAFNMLIGDGKFTPNTPEYRVLMPLCAKIDSIIDTQPFIDIKNKYLGGYSVSQIIEPMLFNNFTPDREGEIILNKLPEARINTPKYTSFAGDILMVVLYVLLVAISFTFPLAAAITIPALTIRKKLNNKTFENHPFYKYF